MSTTGKPKIVYYLHFKTSKRIAVANWQHMELPKMHLFSNSIHPRLNMLAVLITSLFISSVSTKLCPSRCFCSKSLSSVYCSGKKLTAFPTNIPTAVQKLYMDHNLLTEIPVGPLSNLSSLIYLDLRNNIINTIEPNAFLGCGQLQQLYLVTNKFTKIGRESFNGAKSLYYLSLSANRLTVIPPLGSLKRLQTLVLEGNQIRDATFPKEYQNLKSLIDVVLSNNPIVTLRNNTFKNLQYSPVTKLEIARSQISKVDLLTFAYLKNIKSLKIGYNPINEWQLVTIMTALRNSSIVSLDIRNISLGGNLPRQTFSLMKNIQDLSLRNNRIVTIQKMAFVDLPKLLHIDLSSCNIMTIEYGAFYNVTNVQILLLSRNKLTSVPRGLPPSLQYLHLENNDIAAIRNDDFLNSTSLSELYLYNNEIHVLQENSFAGLNRLRKLNLDGNKIAILPGSVFSSLVQLVSLSLSKNNLQTIPEHDGFFSTLVSLVHLGLNDNQCSSLPINLFDPLSALMYLELSNNSLARILSGDTNGRLFQGLSKLQKLKLDGNQISVIHDTLLRKLVSLTQLSLARNQISHWGENLFTTTTQLQDLDLSYNLITLVNKTSLKDFTNLRVLDMRKSPFDCSCDLRWFRTWVNKTQVGLPGVKDWKCASPSSWQGKNFLSFDASKIDCTNYTLYYISSGVVGGVLISLLIMGVMYRYRWFVSFRVYRILKSLKPSKPNQRGYDALPGNDKMYDVYISCAEEDFPWIVDKLLPKIDNGKINETQFQGNFRACFSERDFEPHRSHLGNIDRHLLSSHRAFIILSKYYAQCRRCEFELDTILHAMSEGDIEDFTIIVVGKLPAKYVPKSLRKLIENHKYVEFPNVDTAETDFIEKLSDILEREQVRENVVA